MRARFERDPLLTGFSEHEILEMLLFYCIPRVNTNDIAHSLLAKYGTLDRVMSCTPEELEQSGLISRQAAVSLSFFRSLSGYLQRGSQRKRVTVDIMRDVKEYVFCCFKDDRTELVRLFGVNPRKEIASSAVIGQGTFAKVFSNTDILTDAVIRKGFKDIIIAHNHPFSDPDPSESDIETTARLAAKLKDAGVTLLDHIITGQAEVFSFREAGLIRDLF